MKNSTIALIVIIAIAILIVVGLAGSNLFNPTVATPAPSSSLSSTPTVTNAADLKDPADAKTASQVVLKTDKGNITINLYKNDTPKTVTNFVTLGSRGYYNGIIFHRVVSQFVIQAGDPTGTGTGGESIYGATFPDELNSNHQYQAGSVGMANSGPNTNGSQFYIVVGDVTPANLSDLTPAKYTLFGQVADPASMAVVSSIESVPVDSNNKPTTDVKITGFEITQS